MSDKIISWSGHEWLTRERWGQIHPDKTLCWYDPSAIEKIYNTNGEDQLVLKTHYNPKYHPSLGVTSNIGVGLISNLKEFKYGYFEIEAKLPSGKHLWPAFWMWSWDTWPPEIDIFEGYTKRTKNYFNWSHEMLLGKIWNINTNIHLGNYPDNYNLKAKTHWMGFKNPSKHFIKYGCDWTPNHLDFYYNGKKVRSITDKDCLDQLNKTTMNLVINNSVDKNVNTKNPPESEFIINYFRHEK